MFQNFMIDVILGNIKKIFPATWYHQILVIVVGILGALSMLTTFACVIFMPVSSLFPNLTNYLFESCGLCFFSKVGDAMTLIFTNPLFTMIFAAIFLGHRLTLIKNLSGNVVFFELFFDDVFGGCRL